MNSTVTEAELYAIIISYADVISGRFEMFVGGAIAMIVTIFITRDTLNIYLRSVIIVIFSMFSYVQYETVTGLNSRVAQFIDSMRIVTKDQIDKLPSTIGLLDSPVNAASEFATTSVTIVLTWLCCVILMAYPKWLLKAIKN